MADGINFKIFDPVAQLVAGGGTSGGSIPGSSIQSGTITNTQLAPGAAAANVNAGPAGAINASQISGGPFLPLAGGTMSGAITQPLAPIVGTDLTNKTYVDSIVSTPSSIPGSSIQSGTITNTQLAPGVAAANVNAGPAGAINGSQVANAGNAQFGVVKFDPSGDLKDSGVNTGIARVKQPNVGISEFSAGFDLSGNFVVSKAGGIVGVSVPNGTPLQYGNLIFQMDDSSPRSLKIKLVAGSGYIVGGAQPYWDQGNADPPTPFVTGRYIYRNVDTTTFKFLSERVVGEPIGSTLVTAPWDTTLANAPSTTGEGYQEIYNIYVNDGIDDAGFRVTSMYFNPNSFIVIERLTG